MTTGRSKKADSTLTKTSQPKISARADADGNPLPRVPQSLIFGLNITARSTTSRSNQSPVSFRTIQDQKRSPSILKAVVEEAVRRQGNLRESKTSLPSLLSTEERQRLQNDFA
ncbi:hypothetical protein DPMN_006743 [Dreissena polymorpha]|uniref:Uncharacterized protein n=1 Tax=Dreissena polymorpha TaxID=45954 RepID=A0A9D4MSG0_DREPO|nr:hypothetical protein DPMN_006743 [Dreissena polymorpha]